jgi:hypothetical protein
LDAIKGTAILNQTRRIAERYSRDEFVAAYARECKLEPGK